MQTIIHDVLQTHYHKDPQDHFPPIPTIAVNIPIERPTQHLLCFSARYWPEPAAISPEDIRATAAILLHAVKQMEADKDAQSIQQANQGSSGRPLRKYFIKRNYSGDSCLGCFANKVWAPGGVPLHPMNWYCQYRGGLLHS